MKVIRILLIIFIVIFFFGIIYLCANQNTNFSFDNLFSKKNPNTVSINKKTIYVDLAITNEEKSKGLSGRKKLPWNKGMLFIFDYKSIPSFWMKDMQIPIDIIWIKDRYVIDIDENIPYPIKQTNINQLPRYSPSESINFVLEVNAGFCDKEKIKIGDSVEMNFNIN